MELRTRDARRLAVGSQHLDAAGAADVGEALDSLRCLQLDPITVVAHSHHLVLRSRVRDYDPAHLDTLLWGERRLFEYWAHAASIVLAEDYALHHALMRVYPAGKSAYGRRVAEFLHGNEALRDHILDRLREAGPLPAGAFEDRSTVGWVSGGWTTGKNVERMLDVLWFRGEIMVAARAGGKRLWDLASRCLPTGLDRTPLPEAEIVTRSAEHALRALGVARQADIEQHFVRDRYPGLTEVLATLVEAGRVVPVTLEKDPTQWYVHADRLPLLEAAWSPRTTVLSPFDNLICDRARTRRLWDFAFRTEMYVPKAKRRYGYYVLPILHGDRLIGRIAPRVDRRRGVLELEGVYAEDGAPARAGAAVRRAITELATFTGAEHVEYSGPVPEPWRAALLRN
ncbi:crosslink repair DNA glycosylase YcaQ family protein [Amycolatopsis rhabdoformis]|uniref:Crosslink repair DNA glycosylase YcaQ family protein n=1 Tax=Amycolatopsis rhabdoformis TaxID=1448059 RepID=A0ABZ1HYL7_9PSEU|nr:crosslink repair DNA glycosylase YcaQ family protein [Amycolatopsis rhabdoformis]WSE26479.1 crosslink repair DNA glycosylase YcaQ family protein [Amycolatopsis rhabdoformis]